MKDTQFLREVAHGSAEYWATVDLREAVLRKPLGLKFTPEELHAEKDVFHLACFRHGMLVGCLLLRPLDDREIRMRQVVVAPDMQGQGIGRALVAFSEAWARQRGFRRMTLHARETAVAFYEKLGYTAVGGSFEAVTIPHRAMEKVLAGM